MVWEATSNAAGLYKKIPNWPSPFGQVKSITEIICSDEMWVAEIEMAGEAFAKWFWSNFIPQPAEIFRKTFTGGYKCGFYLNIKVKNPVEIVWGAGSARFLAIIVRPFATAAFALWATNIALDALQAWSTVMTIWGRCEPSLGSFYVSDKSAPWSSGDPSGAVPGGVIGFDKYNQVIPGITGIRFGPGPVDLRSYFIVESGPHSASKVEIGHFIDNQFQQATDLGSIGPGERLEGVAVYTGQQLANGAANSGIRITGASGTGLGSILVTAFTGTVQELI